MKTNAIILSILGALPLALASCSKDPESVDDTRPEENPDAYPLTTCVVSGEELGSMGDPVEYRHNGTLVKFCCDECIPKFEEDPDAYLSKLN